MAGCVCVGPASLTEWRLRPGSALRPLQPAGLVAHPAADGGMGCWVHGSRARHTALLSLGAVQRPQLRSRRRFLHLGAPGAPLGFRRPLGDCCPPELSVLCAAERDTSGKGFGKPVPAPPKKKPAAPERPDASPLVQLEREVETVDDVVPEVVTNRILKRLGITVGFPLLVGLGTFPLFYYLKVVQKLEVPDWLPLLSSLLTFGVASLGIPYGVISTSWDPQREGSLLGWREAKANWPVLSATLSQKKS